MTRSETGGFFKAALSALVRFTTGLNAVATIWTFMLVFFVTADVFGRFFLDHPITGTPEIVKSSLVGLAFLYLPHTTWMNRHVRSDLLKSLLGTNFKRVMEVISPLLGVAVFCLVVFTNWTDMVDSWETGEWEGEGTLRVPVAPFRTILIVGSALTALYYAVHCCRSLVGLATRRGEAE